MQHDGRDVGGGAGEPADAGRAARASTWSTRPRRRSPTWSTPASAGGSARSNGRADHQARLAQGDDHGARHRRHPDPEAAVGPGADRRLPHARHRADGTPVAADRRRRLPADLDLVGDVRRRRGALAGGAARARRRAVDRRGRVGAGRPVLERAHRGRRHRRHRRRRRGDALRVRGGRGRSPGGRLPGAPRRDRGDDRQDGHRRLAGRRWHSACSSSLARCSSVSRAGSPPSRMVAR